ncbi:MAG TPA: T9SS type A sorting domain-containing protein [Bacteroidia bacterium]|nr:T9SS type A sorting domain-containing protein [Bacteroidia bacterium]
MKKLFITAFAALSTMAASAQSDLYTFGQSTGTYASLNGATLVSPSAYPGNGESFTITLPFNFRLNGSTANAVNVSTDGLLTLATAGTGKKEIISAGRLDLEDYYDGTTDIYTLTDGVIGSRIFKIEFRQFHPSWSTDSTDHINWQVWLYEGSNDVAIHYGDVTDFDLDNYSTGDGPMVGILHSDTTIINMDSSFFLTGSPSTASMVYDKPTAGIPPSLNGHVLVNTTFTFTRKPDPSTSAPEFAGSAGFDVKVYPNPATGGKINVSVNGANTAVLTLSDLQGRTLQTQTLEAGETQATFTTAELAAGIYLVTAQSNSEVVTQKVHVK